MNKLVDELKQEHEFIIAKEAKELLMEDVTKTIQNIIDATQDQCLSAKPPLKTIMQSAVIKNSSSVDQSIAESIDVDNLRVVNDEGKKVINSKLTLGLSKIRDMKSDNFRMASEAVNYLAIFADHYAKKRLDDTFSVFSDDKKAKKITATHVLNSKSLSAKTDDEMDVDDADVVDDDNVEEEAGAEEADAAPEPPSPEPVEETTVAKTKATKAKLTKTKAAKTKTTKKDDSAVPKDTKSKSTAGKTKATKTKSKAEAVAEAVVEAVEPKQPKTKQTKTKQTKTKQTKTKQTKTKLTKAKLTEATPVPCSVVASGVDDDGYPTYPKFLSPPKA